MTSCFSYTLYAEKVIKIGYHIPLTLPTFSLLRKEKNRLGIKLSEKLIKRIEAAIKEEQHAQESYRKAAEEAEDPETRTFFEQLAKDEEEHEKILKRRLAALKLLGRK